MRKQEARMDRMISKRLQEMTKEEGPGPTAALRRLAVCRGGFTNEAAAAMLDLEIDDPSLEGTLATLRAWQFVTLQSAVDGHLARYAIDPIIAAAVGVDEDAHFAHYAYYESLAQQYHTSGIYTGLDLELGNLEAAFEWALAHDVAAAYWLYNICSDFLIRRGYYERNMEWIQRAAGAADPAADAYVWGAMQNSLGVAYQNFSLGDRRENLRRAVAAYRETLKYHTREVSAQAYAVTQHNLGTAYADLAQIEDRAENLWRAVAAYQEALRYRTPEQAPLAYASTQGVLGLAYRYLAGIEDRADNLRLAIRAHQAALAFYTPGVYPLDYAATQNNLGNAYRDLASVEDHAGNLRRAVAAYQEALRYRTADDEPMAYAATQNNLGTAYRALAEEEDAASNLRRAMAAFENALRHYTPHRNPLDYAATRSNLGSAYRALARLEDETANLDRALAAFEDALQYCTPERAPLDYATTQANLGLAHRDRGDIPAAVACWRESEQCFRRMGLLDKAEMIVEWIDEAEGGRGGNPTGLR
jgi:tetratricopeptide (TPR) repeat protein